MKKKGFTLFELLGVIVVLAVVLSLAVLAYVNLGDNVDKTYYKTLEESLEVSGTNYFYYNNEEAPEIFGEQKRVKLSYLKENNYIEDEVVGSNGEECNLEDSYVGAYKSGLDETKYYVCLICGEYRTEACDLKIDYTLSLRGKEAETNNIYDLNGTRWSSKNIILTFETINEVEKVYVDGNDFSKSCDMKKNGKFYTCEVTVENSGTYSYYGTYKDNRTDSKEIKILIDKTPATFNFQNVGSSNTVEIETTSLKATISNEIKNIIDNESGIKEIEYSLEKEGSKDNYQKVNNASSFKVNKEVEIGKYVLKVRVTNNANLETIKEIKYDVYKKVNIPSTNNYCNSVVYNDENQVLTKEALEFTFSDNEGRNVGDYQVKATLKDGYRWSDNTTSDKTMKCSIAPRPVTITAKNQTITYGNSITKGTDQVTTSGLVSGHSLSTITLSQSTTNVPGGKINISGAKIVKGTTDVTSNYKITYTAGNLTINQREVTITAKNQTITYGNSITKGIEQVTTSGLVSGHTLSAITLSQSTTNVPGGKINISGAKIVSGTTDVTSNYKITYVAGTLTINKATPVITLNKTSGEIYAGTTTTFTEKATVKGTFSNSSNITATATASPATTGEIAANTNQTVTVTGVNNGTTNISIKFTPTDTTNYNTASATFQIKVNLIGYTIKYYLRDAEGGNYGIIATKNYTGKVGSSVGPESVCNVIGSIPCVNVNGTPTKAENKVGDNLAGTTKLTLTSDASANVITYYYDRTCIGTTCDYCAKGSELGECLYKFSDELNLYESGISPDTTNKTARFTGANPNNYLCFGTTSECSKQTSFKMIPNYTDTKTYKNKNRSCARATDNYTNYAKIASNLKNYDFKSSISVVMRVNLQSYISSSLSDIEKSHLIGNWDAGGFGMSIQKKKLYVEMWLNGDSNYTSITSTNNIALNTWYTLVFTYNGDDSDKSNRKLRMYINGVKDKVKTTTGGSIKKPTANTPICVACNPYPGGRELCNGDFIEDGILIYDRALSENEIKTYFSGSIISYPTNKLLYINKTSEDVNVDQYLTRIISTEKPSSAASHQTRLINPYISGREEWDNVYWKDTTTTKNYSQASISTEVNNFLGPGNSYNNIINGTQTFYDMIADSTHTFTNSQEIPTFDSAKILNNEYSSSQTITNKFVVTQLSDLLLAQGNSKLNFSSANYSTLKNSWIYWQPEWTTHQWNTQNFWLIGQNGLCASGTTNGSTCTNKENGNYYQHNDYRVTFNLKETTLFCGGSGNTTYPYIVGSEKCTN